MLQKKFCAIMFSLSVVGSVFILSSTNMHTYSAGEIESKLFQQINDRIKNQTSASSLSQEELEALSQNRSILPIKDITFAIADLKFDPEKGHVKLLECGDGARSKYMGYDRLHGIGALWSQWWQYMNSFNLPMWCIRMPGDPLSRETMAPHFFFELGGRNTTGVTDLQRKILAELFDENGKVTIEDCENYHGIALVRWGRAIQATERFKTIFPNVLFVGDPINNLIRNKYFTNKLFVETNLQEFRPRCKVCPQKYSPELASEIISELKSNIIVIKPPNASKGRGILFTYQEELDALLKLILEHPEQIEDTDPDSSLGYWTTDESMGNTIFLAEEYIPSKNLIVDGKVFDPTLRLIFAFHKDETGSHLKFFDGYWKLPAKSLTDEGSLTEKHKSDISASAVSSAALSSEDFQVATQMLYPAFLSLYNYMLEQNRNLEDNCPYRFSQDDQDSI